MKTICFLWMALLSTPFLQAQTNASVNFSFTVEANANSVQFINTSKNLGDGLKKAFWSFGDGTVIQTGATEGVVHRYAAAATYQVCLKIYRYPTNTHDSVLIGSACKSVTLERRCAAAFQWKDSAVGTSPTQVIKFLGYGASNAGKAIKEICWKFGDGKDTCFAVAAGSSGEKYLSVVHQYSRGGAYNACIRVVFDGGCVAEKCSTVNVPEVRPAADSCAANFTVQAMTTTPLGRKFIAQPWQNNARKPQRICWKFGDGTDSCIQYASSFNGDYRVEHTYAHPGAYEVCVSIKYDGCESRKCNLVNVPQTTPPATCEASILEAATHATNPERRFYVGLQSNKKAEKICWKFGDGTDTCIAFSNPIDPKQLAVTHRYAAPGAYYVCIRVVYAGDCVAERCKPVEIRFPQNNNCGGFIADSVIATNTLLFRGVSIHGPDDDVNGYLWSFGDGTTANGQEVKHAFAAPGNYAVCLNMKTAKGCEVKICKRLELAGNAQPQLELTPNPVAGTLRAVFHSVLQQTMSVRIYNSNGVLVKTFMRNAVAGNNTWTFDLSGLQSGVYSLVVQSQNQFATAIFFKQ